ncbi:hypothetical protein L9F63_019985 [Diploptera punctata]|uniref:MD-2-related lipid-recognition domain-containing protein n=1 Tax=Diploptera punctata TaxID=6984 RepID=A0AAD8EDJ3_DIPPU|nr:hypothetical protein L9F63_019985 [Diploptera punctata]
MLLAVASSTPVESCKEEGKSHEESDNFVIGSCTRQPCKLKRKSTIDLEFKFIAPEDTPSITNNVHARILGIPFPFFGVDGTDACGQIFNPDGSKAGCPLKGGRQYVYKNSFKVLEVYPKLKVVVHWALTSPKNRDVMCFNVPAKITG